MALPCLSVIEGFYGEAWDAASRSRMLEFIALHQMQGYCYAPKSDIHLRQQWQSDWPVDVFESLLALRDKANSLNIDFSIGLTPLDLHKTWADKGSRQQLVKRLTPMKSLQLRSMVVLFDDMWGDDPLLAQCQADISHCIADTLGLEALTICPTYYSSDPILEQLFGRKPKHYWSDLGALLDKAIGICWTGDKVISEDYDTQALQRITDEFQRKPMIWDNSRVSDGKKTSPFLPLKRMPDFEAINASIQGVMINPMNAASLAQLNLQSLFLDKGQGIETVIRDVMPEAAEAMIAMLPLLTDVGLDALTKEQVRSLKLFCEQSPSSYSHDIKRWINADFRFDPACLT